MFIGAILSINNKNHLYQRVIKIMNKKYIYIWNAKLIRMLPIYKITCSLDI